MDIFIEKEFLENFEIEYSPEKCTKVQGVLYQIFSEYTGIKIYINTTEKELDQLIPNSELLLNILNYNPSIYCVNDFFNYITTNKTSIQTLVFTEDNKEWFTSFLNKDIMCFSWDNYEALISEFLDKTNLKIDLSDCEYPFNWKIFNFIESKTSFLLFTDNYILNDGNNQRIKDNLAELLKDNLNRDIEYKIFILSKLTDTINVIEKKISILNRILANFKVKIYVFNLEYFNESKFYHDRLLYTNYTVTDVGKGFNLNNREGNSIIRCESIFDKITYKRIANHFSKIKEHVKALEKKEFHNDIFITNSKKAYNELNSIL